MNKKLLGSVTGVAATGLIGAALYLAAPVFASSSASGQSATATKTAKDGHHIRLRHGFAHGIHGEATVKTKQGFAQVAWQRGQVTTIGNGTFTVRSIDGATWQWTLTKNTRVRKDGQQSDPTKLAQNDYIVVFGPQNGATRTARAVVVPKRIPPKATQSPGPSR